MYIRVYTHIYIYTYCICIYAYTHLHIYLHISYISIFIFRYLYVLTCFSSKKHVSNSTLLILFCLNQQRYAGFFLEDVAEIMLLVITKGQFSRFSV